VRKTFCFASLKLATPECIALDCESQSHVSPKTDDASQSTSVSLQSGHLFLHEECLLGVATLTFSYGKPNVDYSIQILRRLLRASASIGAVVTSLWPIFPLIAPYLPSRRFSNAPPIPTIPDEILPALEKFEKRRSGSWLHLSREEATYLGAIQDKFRDSKDLPNLIPLSFVNEYCSRCPANIDFFFNKTRVFKYHATVHQKPSLGFATILAGARCDVWSEAVLTLITQVRNSPFSTHVPFYVLSLCPKHNAKLKAEGGIILDCRYWLSQKIFPHTSIRSDLSVSGWIRLLLWTLPVDEVIYLDADVVITDLAQLVDTARRVLSTKTFAAAPLDPWVKPQRLNTGVMLIRTNNTVYKEMEQALKHKIFFDHPVMRAGGFLDQAWLDLWWTSLPQNRANTKILPLSLNLPVSFPALNWDPTGTYFCIDAPIVIHFMGDAWKPFDRSEVLFLSLPEKLWWENYFFWCWFRQHPCNLALSSSELSSSWVMRSVKKTSSRKPVVKSMPVVATNRTLS